jgi:hypothetical protein
LRQDEVVNVKDGHQCERDRDEKEDAACRRKFVKDTREEITDDAKRARPGSNGRAGVRFDVLPVEAGAFAGFDFELRPEFVHFHSGGQAVPALLKRH